ncbi:hypothetical protein SPRG_01454 [Saprolegnia parasitica CBS 223.65]|uniref:Uncharacterized protein n=1 Tax=Saprolegnia parasitica (strain CBS 223.65) TaxID=695850 RepID=A0A067CUE8_SAPPC|nr:hypothetical protein SPRG_01454 [Saprolegnia parasitica CBS 223.65]KDO34319.1 hypothetical protein SPRG_01454 [Saprolegnia parasitica CBS 223.65]|eukprot:XP_012195056.1 hypothetical protein SPRG_01454 [Saprolegnia parasitica CBS 223.65]
MDSNTNPVVPAAGTATPRRQAARGRPTRDAQIAASPRRPNHSLVFDKSALVTPSGNGGTALRFHAVKFRLDTITMYRNDYPTDTESQLTDVSIATMVWHLVRCIMGNDAIIGRMATAVQPMWTYVVPSTIGTAMAHVPAATGDHAMRDHVWVHVDIKSYAVQLFNTTEGPLGDILADPSTNRLYVISTNSVRRHVVDDRVQLVGADWFLEAFRVMSDVELTNIVRSVTNCCLDKGSSYNVQPVAPLPRVPNRATIPSSPPRNGSDSESGTPGSGKQAKRKATTVLQDQPAAQVRRLDPALYTPAAAPVVVAPAAAPVVVAPAAAPVAVAHAAAEALDTPPQVVTPASHTELLAAVQDLRGEIARLRGLPERVLAIEATMASDKVLIEELMARMDLL